MHQPQRSSGPDLQEVRGTRVAWLIKDSGVVQQSLCTNRKEVVDLINLQEDRGTRVSQQIKDSGMVQVVTSRLQTATEKEEEPHEEYVHNSVLLIGKWVLRDMRSLSWRHKLAEKFSSLSEYKCRYYYFF